MGAPRPNGGREGPAPQAREGEGEAQIPSRFREQMRRRKLPLIIPSLTRWVLLSDCRRASPRGERRKGASSLNAIALPLRGGAGWGSAWSAARIMRQIRRAD